jgi:hypothetical protein
LGPFKKKIHPTLYVQPKHMDGIGLRILGQSH